MTKNIRLNSRMTGSLINRPAGLRVPRGLALLRALRLRLASVLSLPAGAGAAPDGAPGYFPPVTV